MLILNLMPATPFKKTGTGQKKRFFNAKKKTHLFARVLLGGCNRVANDYSGVCRRFGYDPSWLQVCSYLVAMESQLDVVLPSGCYVVADGCYGVSMRFQYDPSWLHGCS